MTVVLTEKTCLFFVLYCDSLQISIYAVPEKIDQTAFALDAAVKLLDFYDDYFDIPYPLPKQGQWKSHCVSMLRDRRWCSSCYFVTYYNSKKRLDES